MHPFVVGEIACGSLRDRLSSLELLQELPAVAIAEGEDVLGFVERHVLHGKGIRYVDAHLLASVALTEGAKLWTRNKRLRLVAQAPGCAIQDTTAH
jgi:predicted nucleic acid-binding protein